MTEWYPPEQLPPPPGPPPPVRRTLGRGAKIGIAAAVIVTVASIGAAIILIRHEFFAGSGTSSKVASHPTSQRDTVRVASSGLVTVPATGQPKVVVSLYEDFLCPACARFEQAFGPTVSNLIDIGAIAADYSPVSILDSSSSEHYSSRAGAAALCVADDSVDAFRRFHAALFRPDIQPSEIGTSFPDNARLIELAREAGASGVSDCINSGRYVASVTGKATAAQIKGTPTVRINGANYDLTTPDALVTKIKQIVGDVPGIDTATTPGA